MFKHLQAFLALRYNFIKCLKNSSHMKNMAWNLISLICIYTQQ